MTELKTKIIMVCPECGKEIKGRPEWAPQQGYTGNTVYSHIHSLSEILEGKACFYVHTEQTIH